jgi:hypothetical protein
VQQGTHGTVGNDRFARGEQFFESVFLRHA